MVETFFGFKKPPFGDSPDAKQLFASQSWTQVKARLQFLVDHHGAGLLTGEVGAGKSTAARTFTAGLNPNLYKILYLHWTCGSALDLLRQLALELDLILHGDALAQGFAHLQRQGAAQQGLAEQQQSLVPAHYRGDLVRQISEAIVRLNQSKKQHPILICDETQLLPHAALEQLPLLLNVDMDSSHYLLFPPSPLPPAYLTHQLKAAGVSQTLFDDTARQALYQATKGIPRKVNKLAMTSLRVAAARKAAVVNEAILLDATAEALL